MSTPAAGAAPKIPAFGHVVVVVFENHEMNDVLGTSDAPTFNALAHRYASIDNYFAITHPSLPNYLALVSGSTQGITDDCTDCTAPGRSLADTLEAARKSWKTYAEGLPSPGFAGATSGRYAKKHNPFMYFPSVASNPARLSRVVAFPQFAADVRARRLPTFSLVVPDLCNDMHDCSVAIGDTWLKQQIVPLLGSAGLARSVERRSASQPRRSAIASASAVTRSPCPRIRSRVSSAREISASIARTRSARTGGFLRISARCR